MVTVSIVCNTFNHGPYIRETLESFISQKTEFSYEILIYDDASTDNTSDIIREYEAKYPDLIKPIYQTVNQYSKGLRPFMQNMARATGKYVAICEGDDYWCDNNKLQRQISYMETHPDCTFCFSNGYTQYGDKIGKKVIPWNKSSMRRSNQTDFNAGELELLGYIPTASFVYRNGYSFPIFGKGAFHGDTFIKLVMTQYGYAHYFPESMVVYRRSVSNSATAKWIQSPEKYIKQIESFILTFEKLKEFCSHKFDDIFNMRICEWKIEKFFRLGNADELMKISQSTEYKYLKNGNLYYRTLFGLKCKHYKSFSTIRRVLKKNIKSFNQ